MPGMAAGTFVFQQRLDVLLEIHRGRGPHRQNPYHGYPDAHEERLLWRRRAVRFFTTEAQSTFVIVIDFQIRTRWNSSLPWRARA